MRYFIISLIINIAILFIPLQSDEILSKKIEEQVQTKVVLNFVKEAKEEPKEPTPPIVPEPIIEEPIKEPEVEEVKIEPEIVKVEKPKEIKKPKPKKVVKTPKKIPVQEPVVEVPKVEPVEVAPVKEVAAPTIEKKEVINKEGFCKENVGFKVLKEPRADYPKKALMLRLKETFYVEVDFKIINDEIKVVAVRGKNKIFNDEAERLTKDMQIKVLKELDHCVITKPYEFKIKD